MPDPTPPPTLPMYEGVLDDAQVRQLRDDLTTVASVIEVRVRGAAPGRSYSLDEALDQLQRRETPAVQVRYRHDDALWCDTLQSVEGGVRLVRLRQDWVIDEKENPT